MANFPIKKERNNPESIYVISGTERKDMKKELGRLKSFVKHFSFNERFMFQGDPESDDNIQRIKEAKDEIAELEIKLKELK